MGRRRKRGRPIHGWIALDKPYDMTSTEAVSRLRRLFDAQRCGHAGTLDPLATGILPVAFGEATKTVPFVQDSPKSYRFTARWGVATNTDDAEGERIAESAARPSREAIEAALEGFIGEIEQIPPAFSAIKVKGARAYDLARDGETVKLEPRLVNVYDLRLTDIPDADRAVFEAETGKGAYVRALVRDLARALGTVGHVADLRRTAVGPFNEARAVTLAALEEAEQGPDRDACLLPVVAALEALPALEVTGQDVFQLRRGQAVVLTPHQARSLRGGAKGALPAVLAKSDGAAAAICALDGLSLKPARVFNL
ncbi:MAG: tRNA pseudouridine(55) synthase TruB [Parvularculaceae bacterium]